MKLTVLVDNNTYIDQYYVGEPGLSYYIEDGKEKVLFDTGFSDVFIHNAQALNVNLQSLTRIVFSHGHNDHTRGLVYLTKMMNLNAIPLIAHSNCFLPKRHNGLNVGIPMDEECLSKIMRLELTTDPVWLTDKLVYLGEIPRIYDWEKNIAVGEINYCGVWKPDYMMDDSALAYKTQNGIFVITGCSHSGICNIVTRALNVCCDDRLLGIIGGMHLLEMNERVNKTIEFLYDKYRQFANMEKNKFLFYPAHCTSLEVKFKMFQVGLPVQDVGVGLEFSIDN